MIVSYTGYKRNDDEEDLLQSVKSGSGSTYKGASSGAPTLPKISSLERASIVGNPSVYTPKQREKNVVTLPKTSFADKASIAAEKASRVYLQNSPDVYTPPKPKPIQGPRTFTQSSTEYLQPITSYHQSQKPSLTPIKTNNEGWRLNSFEEPATPTPMRQGTSVFDRVYNAFGSIGDNLIGSDKSLKATLNASYNNEKKYKQTLRSLDNQINELMLQRNKYSPESKEYKQLNEAINNLYESVDNLRNRTADVTEANEFMQNSAMLREQAKEGLSGPAKQFVDTSISVGNSLVPMIMTGFNPTATVALMGAQTAGNRANELSNEGVSARDALGRGVVSGVVEGLTEKIGIDNLYGIVKSNNVKLLSSLLRQAASEGTEEGLSNVLNYAADRMAGDKKSFDWDDFANSIIQGVYSGFMFGVGGTVVNRVLPRAMGYSDMNSMNKAQELNSINFNNILPRGNANYSSDVSNANINVARNYADGTTDVLPINQYLDEYSKGKQYAKDIINNNTLALPKPSDYYTTSEGILTKRPTETWNIPQKYETVYDDFETVEFKPSGEIEVDDGSLSNRDVSAYNFVKSKADELNTTTKKVYDAYKKGRDNLYNKAVEEWFNTYKNYKPQGTQMIISNNEQIGGVPVDRYTRISNNEPWYSEVFSIYGHKPNQSQLKQFVEMKVTDDINNSRGQYVDSETAKTIRTYDNLLEGYNKVTSNGEKNVLDIRLNKNGNYEVDYGNPREQIINDPTKFYQGRMALRESILPDATNSSQTTSKNIVQASFDVIDGNITKQEQGFSDGTYNYYKQGNEWIAVDPVTGTKVGNPQRTLVAAIHNVDKSSSDYVKDVSGLRTADNDEIADYVSNSLKNKKQDMFMKIGEVSNRLKNDMSKIGINIKGFVHALRDNDIRHIDKSHGSKSNDKYKVNESDYRLLNDIFNNYDVLYEGYKTKSGNRTIAYEKIYDNKVYVVEEIYEDGILSVKQILKTGLDSKPSFLKKMKKISSKTNANVASSVTRSTDYINSPPGEHVPDVNLTTNNIIPQRAENINTTPRPLGERKVLPTALSDDNTNNDFRTAAMNMKNNTSSLSINPKELGERQVLPTAENISNVGNSQIKGDSESRFKESMQTQKVYGDEFKTRAADNDNINTYNRISNEETFNMASERLKTNGVEEANRWLNIDPKEASTIDRAEGMILAKQYEQDGNYEGMINVIEHLRKMATSAGQSTQIFAALQRMTPEGMVYYAEKSLDNAYNKFSKGKTKKWKAENSNKFKLTEDDAKFIKENMEKVANSNNRREKDILIAEIQARISEKVPATTREQLNTLARISMLFNLKTQIRNVLGNVVVIPRTVASDVIGTGIDKALSKKSGIRTTGIFDFSSIKGMKQGVSEAYYDYRHGINTRDVQDGRFELRNTSAFKGNNILSKGVKTIDDLTSFMLDAGDRGFWQMWYDNSLSNQMALNNVTEATQEMKDIAAIEAAERTWQDNNGYTDFVSNIKRGLNRINFKGYGLGDVMMPFVKTPANLVKAVVDYSPIGVLNALVKDSKNLQSAIDTGKNVSVAQRRYVNDLSKGITGTLLMALYSVLANKEVIKGDAADDKDVRNFEKNILGILPYAIKIGDKTYSYEWAQPVGGTMAVVANALEGYKTSKEQGDSGYLNIFNAIYSGAQAMGTTLFNLSFMDGLKSLFDSDDFIQGIVDAIGAEPAKFLPTALGQVAQTMDDYNRTTYVSGNPLMTNVNKVLLKLPGARETLPKAVDLLGRDVKGNNSLFDAFVNPVNYSRENTAASADEIYSIYKETGNKAVIPPTAPYSVTYNNEKVALSPEETASYQKTTGSIINQGIEDLINNPDYNNMSAADKAEVMIDLYAYAQEKAKAQVIDNYEISNTSKEAEEAANSGLSEADYYLYKYYLNKKDDNGDTMSSDEKREILRNNSTLTANEKNKLDDLLIDDYTFIPKDVSVDYSSDESFIVSQMSSGEKEKYGIVQGILPAESYSYLYDTVYGLESGVDYPKGERSPFAKSLIDAYLEKYGYNPTYNDRMKIYESMGVAKKYRY